MCSEIEASARIFLVDRNGFNLYTIGIENHSVFITWDNDYLLEHFCKKHPFTTDLLCHKVNIHCWAGFQTINGIKQ